MATCYRSQPPLSPILSFSFLCLSLFLSNFISVSLSLSSTLSLHVCVSFFLSLLFIHFSYCFAIIKCRNIVLTTLFPSCLFLSHSFSLFISFSRFLSVVLTVFLSPVSVYLPLFFSLSTPPLLHPHPPFSLNPSLPLSDPSA